MEISQDDFRLKVGNLRNAVARSGLNGQGRYDALSAFDPFAKTIPPALLNAGHLATYALAAGMIEPFDIGSLTKPATYLVAAEGPVRYRNENGKVERFYLSSDPCKRHTEHSVRDIVRIAPNSVCFLTLEPTFRMPSYIGARFNLLIRDVYRGLLVGTGPLVDPGFSGRLSIPIHNFTSREYYIRAGEGLVYFEFTKLSWTNAPQTTSDLTWLPEQIDDQPPFPTSKNKRRTLDDYLDQATGNGPPQSAIGIEVANMQKHADRAKILLSVYSIGGFIATAVLIFTVWSVYAAAQQFAAAAQTELRGSRASLQIELQALKDEVEEYRGRMMLLERRNDRLISAPTRSQDR